MIRKKIKCFIFALFCILTVQLPFASTSMAAATPNSGGLFNDEILQKMNQFMVKTNEALHMVMMVGDGLMCYATKVHYHTVDLELVEFSYPDLGFLLVGFIIYVVGVLMAMSVGMYFVDIAFKFGFAIVFMPVSIALWPFPPTKSKFADNLSIIIRNAMLFMLVGIGVAYAVKLINHGLLADGAETDFWSAIENDEVEQLTNSFSFFNTHILVVFFTLIYGFKILEGSVNNYLNAFFSDAAFGSESPMHHMGTQAVGMVAENTVKPALSYAKDVATHQTGLAIAGAAKGASKVFSSEGRAQIGRGIKNGYNKVKGGVTTAAKGITFAVQNPGQAINNTAQFARTQYNKGMQKAGAAANSAIHKAGEAAKSIHDNVTAFVPLPLRESWRQEQVGAFNKLVDKATNKLGNAAEKTISKGGGAMRKAALNPRTTYNNAMQAAGKGVNKAVHGAESTVLKAYRANLDRKFENKVNQANKQFKKGLITDGQRNQLIKDAENERVQKIQNFKGKSNELAQKAFLSATGLQAKLGHKDEDWWKKKNAAFDKIRKDGASLSDVVGGKAENAVAHGGRTAQAAIGAKLHNMRADDDNKITTEEMSERLQQKSEQRAKDKATAKAERDNLKAQEKAQKDAEKAQRDAPKIASKAAKQAEEDAFKPLKDKTQKAEENFKQAEATQRGALQKLGTAQRKVALSLPKNKELYKEELKIAQEEYKRAVDKLNKAKAELNAAQQEYMQAIDQSKVSGVKKIIKKAQVYNQQSESAPISLLAPSKIISTTFRLVRHPKKQMERIADNFKELKGDDKKIILKKSGQIVLRSVKDAGRDAVKLVDTTGSVLTSMLQKFGEGLADNSANGGQRKSIAQQWKERNAEMIRQKAEEAEQNDYFREMSGD